eukprot:3680423-Rhodomonas_salina.1
MYTVYPGTWGTRGTRVCTKPSLGRPAKCRSWNVLVPSKFRNTTVAKGPTGSTKRPFLSSLFLSAPYLVQQRITITFSIKFLTT